MGHGFRIILCSFARNGASVAEYKQIGGQIDIFYNRLKNETYNI